MKQLFWGYTIDDNTVVRQKNGTVLKSRPNNKGYLQVSLMDFDGIVGIRRWYLVHRLVAHIFCHNPRPDVFNVVDHIDGDPTNNLPVNLRWVNNHLKVHAPKCVMESRDIVPGAGHFFRCGDELET